MCFGGRVPNGEINVTGRQTIVSPFPALPCVCCHHQPRAAARAQHSGRMGKAQPHRVTWGVGGVGDPASLGSLSAVSRQQQGPGGKVGCHASMQTGSRESWHHGYLFRQVGNGKPGILTWPSTVGGEDTERRVAPGPQWEDLGPPPQEASSLK